MNKIFIFLLLVLLGGIIDASATPFTLKVASSMSKIRKDGTGLSQAKELSQVDIDIARDESESFQLVVIPENQALNNVTVDIVGLDSNLKIRWYAVDYVKCGKSAYSQETINWVPDPLFSKDSFSVKAGEWQTLWFSVLTTPETKPGNYSCTIHVRSNGTTRSQPVTIKVRRFVLPRPGTLATPFGNYRKVLEDWYFGTPGLLAKRHYDTWCKFIAEYRLSPKEIGTDYITEVKETINGENRITNIDYSKLYNVFPSLQEQYLPDYTYHFYRLPSGSTLETALNTPGHPWHDTKKLVAPIFTYWEKWKEIGFSDKAFLYGVDEPNSTVSVNGAAAIYREIKKYNSDIKIMVTGNCNKSEFKGLVDIWCPKTNIAWQSFFKDRLSEGNTLWQYVCVTPSAPYANFFVDEPGVDHRNLFWQTRKNGATGFLYWTVTWVDKYPVKPYMSTSAFPNSPWDYTISSNPTGDGMLVYPGKNYTPIPSIRLEIIRDGIEDYEYFSVLANLVQEMEQRPEFNETVTRAKALLKIPDSIVKSASVYTKDENLISDYRTQLSNTIEELLVARDLTESTDGSIDSPYLIQSKNDLLKIADDVNNHNITYENKYFVLTNNIDLEGMEWHPIGGISESFNFECVFKGNIDGGGFSINNFTISQSSKNGIAFVGTLENGSISNLTVKDAQISGKTFVGSLVGFAIHSKITNCHTTCTVSGIDFVGGIVGKSASSTIVKSSSAGKVKGENYVGGIVGGVYDYTK